MHCCPLCHLSCQCVLLPIVLSVAPPCAVARRAAHRSTACCCRHAACRVAVHCWPSYRLSHRCMLLPVVPPVMLWCATGARVSLWCEGGWHQVVGPAYRTW